MTITCPQCGFSRAVAKDRLAGKSVVAICPKCSCRFRFSAKNGVECVLPPKGWQYITHDPDGKADHVAADENQEEDIRQTAAEAYRREAERFAEEADTAREGEIEEQNHGNPWDMAPGNSGWFAAFYQTVLLVMFSAPRFFASLDQRASQTRALVFYLLVCVIQTLVDRLWSNMLQNALISSNTTDPQLQKLLEFMAAQSDVLMNLLIRTGVLVFQIYIFSFLMFLVYRIFARDRATFSLVFQVLAYGAAPALLCVVPVVGSIVGMFWAIICLVVGCKSAMGLNWPQTLAGFLPVVFVVVPVLLQTMTLLQSI